MHVDPGTSSDSRIKLGACGKRMYTHLGKSGMKNEPRFAAAPNGGALPPGDVPAFSAEFLLDLPPFPSGEPRWRELTRAESPPNRDWREMPPTASWELSCPHRAS